MAAIARAHTLSQIPSLHISAPIKPPFPSSSIPFRGRSLELNNTAGSRAPRRLNIRAARMESQKASLGFRAPEFQLPEPLKVFQLLTSVCRVDLIHDKSKMDNVGGKVVVDRANGVGADKLELLKDLYEGGAIEIRNSSKSGGVLNEGVGADFVQKEKIVPSGFSPADNGLREQLSFLDENENENSNDHYHAQLGAVQTAYANGASTAYLKSLGLELRSCLDSYWCEILARRSC